jgi:HEAT repeat protein
MKRLVLFFAAAVAAFPQNEQPNVTNTRFSVQSFSGDLSSQIRATSPSWFGYAIKTVGSGRQCCGCDECSGGGCRLERGETFVKNSKTTALVELEGSKTAAVLVRVSDNKLDKIRLYSLACPLDAGGLPFVWLSGVPVDASVAWLKAVVTGNSTGHLSDSAVFVISQHDSAEALDYLIDAAKHDNSSHVRSQALFWLAQKAGARSASVINNAIENDPDTSVKRQAVFALSRLPADEAIPKLIDLAHNHRNPEVRKQAFFWLGQSGDPRALAFIEQVLTK